MKIVNNSMGKSIAASKKKIKSINNKSTDRL